MRGRALISACGGASRGLTSASVGASAATPDPADGCCCCGCCCCLAAVLSASPCAACSTPLGVVAVDGGPLAMEEASDGDNAEDGRRWLVATGGGCCSFGGFSGWGVAVVGLGFSSPGFLLLRFFAEEPLPPEPLPAGWPFAASAAGVATGDGRCSLMGVAAVAEAWPFCWRWCSPFFRPPAARVGCGTLFAALFRRERVPTNNTAADAISAPMPPK